MKKMRTPKDKAKLILYVSVALVTLFSAAVMIVVGRVADLPAVVLGMLFYPLMVGGMWLLGKIMDRSKYKDVFDELNKEAEMEEEEEEKKRGQKPNVGGLVLLVVMIFLFAVFGGIEMVVNMVDNRSFVDYLPDLCMVLTGLVCGALLARIAYNIRKGKVFYSGNVRLIYLIAVTILLSAGTQHHYWESTAMVPNTAVFFCYMVFVGLCFFFGNLFSIAIQIKEDQDLTI